MHPAESRRAIITVDVRCVHFFHLAQSAIAGRFLLLHSIKIVAGYACGYARKRKTNSALGKHTRREIEENRTKTVNTCQLVNHRIV